MKAETMRDLVRLASDVAVAAIEGTTPATVVVVARLISIALDLVPADDLRAHLDAAAAARIDREVDAAVEAKLGRQ